MRQPRVPEYRENESVVRYLKSLVLFLKDFCNESWTASTLAKKGLEGVQQGLDGISYPVTSVFNRTGDVVLQKNDLANVQKGTWNGNTSPEDIPYGITYAEGSTASSTGFPANLVVVLSVKHGMYRAMQILAEKTTGNLYIRSSTDGSTWGSWKRHMAALEIYPVGAIYLSTSSTSPASLFGGTWEQMKDRFLLGAGDTYTAGGTGGAATVALTTSQMPSHTHTFTGTAASHDHTSRIYTNNNSNFTMATAGIRLSSPSWIAAGNTTAGSTGGDTCGVTASTSVTPKGTNSNTGGGTAHNNMPPYLTVYMWKRVS